MVLFGKGGGTVNIGRVSPTSIRVWCDNYPDTETVWCEYSDATTVFSHCHMALVMNGEMFVNKINDNPSFVTIVDAGDIAMFKVSGDFSAIERIDSDSCESLGQVKPPIVVTGHSGGGTSILFKFLRVVGMHVGTDCGVLDVRKPHESISLRAMLTSFERYAKPLDGSEWKKEMRYSDSHNVVLLDRMLRRTFDHFWGGYPHDATWGFKLPDLYNTSTIICDYWPDAKFLSVVKSQKDDGTSVNMEGKKFVDAPWEKVFESQRPLLKGNSIFHVDYERFFSDITYANRVLKFCGLELVSEGDFTRILQEIKFVKKF